MSARELPSRFLVGFSFAGEHRDLARALAEGVEQEIGSPNVFFDEWFQHLLAGPNSEQMISDIYIERCALVVVCVSERSAHDTDKSWTRAEYAAIQTRTMKERYSTDERDAATLPIRVGAGEVEGIPFNSITPETRGRPVHEVVKLIIERLRLVVPDFDKSSAVRASWPEEPPALSWPVADRADVHAALKRFLTLSTPWRVLSLLGHSGTGKTYIVRQILANGLRIPNVSSGVLDFKGWTTFTDQALKAFAQELDVPMPHGPQRLSEQFAVILDYLENRARPTLLIFDTYEAAGWAAKWVEEQLLPLVLYADWLRVVIAGKVVPQVTGTVWENYAAPVISLTPPKAADWLEWAQRHHRSGVTLDFVEQVCALARDDAPVLAQIFGRPS